MKLLVVKIGAIGDVVMSLSIVTAAKKLSSDVHITWICGRSVAPILKIVEGIDEVIEVDDHRLLKGSFIQKLQALTSVWPKLLKRKFDLVINGHADPRYKLLVFPLFKVPVRSFSRTAKRIVPIPGRHHSDEYARLLVGNDNEHIEYFDLPRVKIPALELGEFPAVTKKIILFPGGAKNVLRDDMLRRWSIESYVSLAGLLMNDNYVVIIGGATSDEWVLEHFRDVAVVNTIGKYNLVENLALIESCDLLITHDSGPLHMGGLVRVPLIALFGPTNPHEKVPRTNKYSSTIWGGEQLLCRPCYDGVNYAHCIEHNCMRNISPIVVYQKAINIFNENDSE